MNDKFKHVIDICTTNLSYTLKHLSGLELSPLPQCYLFWDKVSLYSPGWLGTHCADQGGLDFIGIYLSLSAGMEGVGSNTEIQCFFCNGIYGVRTLLKCYMLFCLEELTCSLYCTTLFLHLTVGWEQIDDYAKAKSVIIATNSSKYLSIYVFSFLIFFW